MSRPFRRNRAARIRWSWPLVAAWAACLGTVAGVQVATSPPQRDGPASQAALIHDRRIPVGTASISGIVTAADRDSPIAGARVTVSGQARPIGVSPLVRSETMSLTRTVITDATGQFSFSRLPPGEFRISVFALHNQFLETSFGQRRPGGAGQFVQLIDGQSVTLRVPVVRIAAIAGIVTGPDGDPLQNVQVTALQYVTSGGVRRLHEVDYAQTDDRGAYRLFSVWPGDYIISATPDASRLQAAADADLVERAILSAPVIPARAAGLLATIAFPREKPWQDDVNRVYLPTYAPGSLVTRDAATVTVGGGEQRTGVDIRVQLVPAGAIRGVVSTPLDAGVTAQLWLSSDDQATERLRWNVARLSKDGTFTFSGVAPGTYTVFARTLAETSSMTFVNGQLVQPSPVVLTEAQKMWGQTLVTVSGEEIASTTVHLQASRSISGILVFDTRHQMDLTRARLTVHATVVSSRQQMYGHEDRLQASVTPDGRFTITGVPPGRYKLGLDGHLFLKSAIVSGQDTLDFPMEFTGDRDVTDAVLTVSDRAGELNGTLTDSAGKPPLDYAIVVAAADSRFWGPHSRRVRMAQLDLDGRYLVTRLPAGTYQISVVSDPDPDALSDPEFLRTIARTSIAVTIIDGGKVTQHLRVK